MPTSLAELERRIEQLEAATAGEVGGVPSYVKVNPDGSIAYDFSGHIHAAGLDLDEALNPPPVDPNHKVQWLDTSGVARAFLVGIDAATTPHALWAGSGANICSIIDGTGASSFLQLINDPASAVRRVVNMGTDTAPTNGANGANKSVTHNLPLAPSMALATPTGDANAIAQIITLGPAAVSVRISHRDAGSVFGSNTSFYWLAIV